MGEDAASLNCYTEEYDQAIRTLKAALEPVAEQRAPLRMQEMQDYLNEKLPEAREKIADAERQLADAEKQLTDAANELADARQQIADGEKELEDGRAELERQKKQYGQYEKQYSEGKAELEAAESQMMAVDVARAQLAAGKAQINAVMARMENLPAGSVLLPILADSLAPTLNELTDANGKKLNLGVNLYDDEGNVTPEKVATTRRALEDYFAKMERQLSSAVTEYESGKKELEQSRKDLNTFDAEL